MKKKRLGILPVLMTLLVVVVFSVTAHAQTTSSSISDQQASSSDPKKLSLETTSLSMNVGDYRDICVDTAKVSSDWKPLTSPFFRSETIVDAQGNSYVRITALSVGKAYAGIQTATETISFPVEIQEAQLKLDTNREVVLQTGMRYGFLLTDVSPIGQTPLVKADGVQLQQMERTGLPQNTYYYEITALSAGTTRVEVSCGSTQIAFPITITQSEMEKKAQQYTSPTGFMVLTDLTAQRTAVFQGTKGNWKMIQAYLCSTGTKGAETPKGEYQVQGRGSWFFSRSLREGAEWYVQFWGDYLYHSLPMDAKHNVTDSRLGQPLSHGCIRLRIEDAKWLYDTLPRQSKVVIY